MEPIQSYENTFVVQQEECDIFNKMMPAAFLRRAQQASIDHCNHVGLTEEVYKQTHTAFLMAKVAIEFFAPVYAGQQLTLTTIPFSPKRAMYHRICKFCDQHGSLVALYDSHWILVNTDTRRILRQPPQEMNFPFLLPIEKELDFSFEKPPFEKVSHSCASYSLCDCNGHINHTRYADLFCDCLDPELIKKHRISKMVLVYHHEIPFGNPFDISYGYKDNQLYVAAQSHEKACTEGAIWLQ